MRTCLMRPVVFARCARGVALVALVASMASTAWSIEFADSIEQARQGDGRNRPVVVHFNAPWCGWCRKMSSITFADESVRAVEDEFLWVSIDVDDQPEVAGRFQVFGVPHTIVLDGTGRLRAARGGYMAPDVFVEFLKSALSEPQGEPTADDTLDDVLQQLRDETSGPKLNAAVAESIRQLARPDRSRRTEILDALAKRGADAWPSLWEQTADEHLAVRAAAAVALNHSAQADLPLHPFADAATRHKQRIEWKAWIDLHRPSQSEAPTGDDGTQTPPAADPGEEPQAAGPAESGP